jgi:hypothetical protein
MERRRAPRAKPKQTKLFLVLYQKEAFRLLFFFEKKNRKTFVLLAFSGWKPCVSGGPGRAAPRPVLNLLFTPPATFLFG